MNYLECSLKFEVSVVAKHIEAFQRLPLFVETNCDKLNNRAHLTIIDYIAGIENEIQLREEIRSAVKEISSIPIKTTDFKVFPNSGTLYLGVEDSTRLSDVKVFLQSKLNSLKRIGVLTGKPTSAWHITVCSGLPRQFHAEMIAFGNTNYADVLGKKLNLNQITCTFRLMPEKRYLKNTSIQLKEDISYEPLVQNNQLKLL